MPYGWAIVFAYAAGMAIAFWLNSRYVFPASDKPVQKQARDFFAINLCFFPIVWFAALQLNEALLELGVSRYSEEVAHGIAISFPVLGTFLLYKFVAFREKYYG